MEHARFRNRLSDFTVDAFVRSAAGRPIARHRCGDTTRGFKKLYDLIRSARHVLPWLDAEKVEEKVIYESHVALNVFHKEPVVRTLNGRLESGAGALQFGLAEVETLSP